MKQYIIFLLVLFTKPLCFLQINAQTSWTDSMLNSMSVDERFGQLFVIRSFAKNVEEECLLLEPLIQNYHIGGVCFFRGTIPIMVELINRYQSMSKYPLMMSIDAEWGLGMRMTDGVNFPKQMTLGAIEDNHWIYKMGREIATQLKDVGIHMNYAPVLDINNNISNPVINQRAFSSNRKKVIAKSFAYMQGLQDGGILACLKHFPGHGDTETDSHLDLATLTHSRERLDSVELYPFKAMFDLHPSSVMVAHLNIPALDSTQNIPATLSHPIINNLLRKNYNFNGLVITDALEMKGVTKNFNAGEIALRAFKAGNDILLLSENIPAAIEALKLAMSTGEISMVDLNAKVKRILNAKYNVGLNNVKRIMLDSSWHKITNLRSTLLKETLYKKALTLAKDENNLVPIRKIHSKIICLGINSKPENGFQKRLQDYANVCTYSLSNMVQLTQQLILDIEEADLVILSLHNLNYQRTKNYGLNLELVEALNLLIAQKSCIITIFGCPYVSMFFTKNCSVFLAYEDNDMTHDIAAQMVFGVDPIGGVSSVNTAEVLEEGKGINRPSLQRMGFSIPEAQGMNSDSLMKIDSLVQELIQQHAAPGCQIVVAKNNSIVFRKSYGYFTYDSLVLVDDKSMYDLASLTKIVGSAPVLMLLDDQNKIQFRKTFSEYLPEFSTSNKSDLTIKDFLLHQGKLISWIPFYKSTLISPDTLNIINDRFYDSVSSFQYSIPVSDSMYLRNDYSDSIFQTILASKILTDKKFVYSDIGFYFVPKLIQKITKQPFEQYYNKNFVQPLSLRHTTFNPLAKYYPKAQIPPTEIDRYFRHKVIQGYVHDMGAAMMGGISGHAGLFSTATEVAIIMQMLLNHGNYGGVEYISSSTISKFTERDPELQRRALVFDMPELIDTITSYVSPLASKKTFGHQGFTGTCAWVDPEHKLIYVFLSNRSYPDSKINLLHKNRYRSKIQDVIYRSIQKPVD